MYNDSRLRNKRYEKTNQRRGKDNKLRDFREDFDIFEYRFNMPSRQNFLNIPDIRMKLIVTHYPFVCYYSADKMNRLVLTLGKNAFPDIF